MEKKQNISLLSDSPSEVEVPDLELVPPIKTKKRLIRRIKLPSKHTDTNPISTNKDFRKTGFICSYIFVVLLIVSLVTANAYLTYLFTDTRTQLQMLSNKVARIHAESVERYEAKLSLEREKYIETAVLKARELLNADPPMSPDVVRQLIGLNINSIMAIVVEDRAKIMGLMSNVSELHELCFHACQSPSSSTTTTQLPTPRQGGRP